MLIIAHFVNKHYNCDITITESKKYFLNFTIDGIDFVADDFDDFRLKNNSDFELAQPKFDLKPFKYTILGTNTEVLEYSLQEYSLLDLKISTIVIDKSTNLDINAYIFINNIFDVKCFQLLINDEIYSLDNPNKDFEYSFSQICKKISSKYYLKNCFGCIYSDYSPYGQNDFGSMYCFLNGGDIYKHHREKGVYDDDIELSFGTSEISLCNDFKVRNKILGCRGGIYPITIQSERVYIRQFKPSDWIDLAEILTNPNVNEFEPYNLFKYQDCERECLMLSNRRDFWAVVLKSSDKVIGKIYFNNFFDYKTTNNFEIGYAFNEIYQGFGYAFESCKSFIDYMIENQTLGDIDTIFVEINPLNEKSKRLINKLGFILDSSNEKYLKYVKVIKGD